MKRRRLYDLMSESQLTGDSGVVRERLRSAYKHYSDPVSLDTAPYSSSALQLRLPDTDDCEDAVFNLDFTPDGNLLGVVGGPRKFLIVDPRTRETVASNPRAHSTFVNCVKFLGRTQQVATCSDDEKVKVWDLRHLDRPVAVMKGHNGWVKNINYDELTGYVITSSFACDVLAWHPFNPDRMTPLYESLSSQPGRCVLSDSGRTLAYSRGTQLTVIHNFSLTPVLNKDYTLTRAACFRNREHNIMERFAVQDVKAQAPSLNLHPFDNLLVMAFDDERSRLSYFYIYTMNTPRPVVTQIPGCFHVDYLRESHFSADGSLFLFTRGNEVVLAPVLSNGLNMAQRGSVTTDCDDELLTVRHNPMRFQLAVGASDGNLHFSEYQP